MSNLKPVNGHLLIEPVKREEFIASERNTYQEKGVILDIAHDVLGQLSNESDEEIECISEGDIVYFDSWLAKKFPKGDTVDEFLWLVKWEDVALVEYEQPLSK